MKKIHISVILIFLIMVFHYFTDTAISKKKFNYVGIEKCRSCHSGATMNNQFAIWESSPHAKAVLRLKTKKALLIAKEYSIKNPEQDIKCLKCHTTGGGRVKATINEGVGCESCHGPASKYYEFSNHVDFHYKKNGYVKAKRNGMFPILDYEPNLLNRKRLCLFCHNKTRLCYPKTRNEARKQKISIQVIDSLIKGDIKFAHPIRNY